MLIDDFICLICKEAFGDKQKCIDHIQKIHNPNNLDDYDDSGSDSDLNLGNSSESEEDSSGEESSEIQTDNEHENGSCHEDKRKRKRNTKPHCDTEEQKNSKNIVSTFTYNESLKNFLHRLIKSFINYYWKDELLTSFIPPKISSEPDVQKIIASLNYYPKSLKFSLKSVESYLSKFNPEQNEEIQQLKCDEISLKGNDTTLFCGGSISSIDWAPVEENCDLDFLAVACNRPKEKLNLGLETTSISTIQIYQFKYNKHSTNECKLSYIFTVFEGPIWSIKFHPSQSTLSNRIGLLAVTTANQNILIFSLPFLHGDHSLSLQLEPCLVCKLDSSDILFKDQYLYQATAVNWMVDQSKETILGAGYMSGAFAIWKVNENDKYSQFPIHYVQAHNEPITSIDFKVSNIDSYYILSTSLERKSITHLVQDFYITETSNHASLTRITSAEWWMNWPGFMMGSDESLCPSKLEYHQPLDFGRSTLILPSQAFSVKSLSINNWENFVLMVTDTGDVISCQPDQLFATQYRERWQDFKCDIVSFTDFQTIASESGEEIGLVFCDLKVS